MRRAATPMGRRLLVAATLAVVAVVSVGWLYDSADPATAARTLRPARLAPPRPARAPPPPARAPPRGGGAPPEGRGRQGPVAPAAADQRHRDPGPGRGRGGRV